MNEWLWIGTYAKKAEQGIFLVELNKTEKSLSIKEKTSGVENPSYIADTGHHVWAVSEQMDGSVALFEKTGHALQFQSEAAAGEMGPCHITANETGAFSANYGGSVTKYKRDGALIRPEAFQKYDAPLGPNASRQDAPHLHSAVPFPDGEHVLVCDLGTDTLLVLDQTTLVIVSEQKTAPGAGPRMSRFHPSLPIVYVMNELDSTVSVYKVEGPSLLHLHTEEALPMDFHGDHTGADVQLSHDGQFLYAAVRGWDGLTVFHVQPDGSLSNPRHVKLDGKTPRSFWACEDAPFLIVAFQDSDEVCLYETAENGLPSFTGSRVLIQAPVCVISAVISKGE